MDNGVYTAQPFNRKVESPPLSDEGKTARWQHLILS